MKSIVRPFEGETDMVSPGGMEVVSPEPLLAATPRRGLRGRDDGRWPDSNFSVGPD